MIAIFNKERFTIPFIKNLVFEEFYFHKVHLGENILYWESTNKPFALCFYKAQAIIDLYVTISKMKYLFYFLIHAFSFTKNILFFSIGGLPFNQKNKIFESLTAIKTLDNPYIVGWLNGLLTNFPKIVNQFWLKKNKNRSEFKKEWFLKTKEGLKSLSKFPDFFVFFSIKGPYNSAFKEACKFNSPIIAFLDTDSAFYNIQFPIGGNDDSLYSLKLYVILLRETIIRGLTDKLFDILTKNFLWRFKLQTIKFVMNLKTFLKKTQQNLGKSLSYENKFESFLFTKYLVNNQFSMILKKKITKNISLDKNLFLKLKNYFVFGEFGTLFFYFSFVFEKAFVTHEALVSFFNILKVKNIYKTSYSIFRFFFIFFRYNINFLEASLKENFKLNTLFNLKQISKIFGSKILTKRILKNITEKKQKKENNINIKKNSVDYSEEYSNFFEVTQNFINYENLEKKNRDLKFIISSFKNNYKLKYYEFLKKTKIFIFLQKNINNIKKMNNYLTIQFYNFLQKQKSISNNVKNKKDFIYIKIILKLFIQYKIFFIENVKLRNFLYSSFILEKDAENKEENILFFLKKRFLMKKKQTKNYLFHILNKIITKLKMKILFKKEMIILKNFLNKIKKEEFSFFQNNKKAIYLNKQIKTLFSTKKNTLQDIQTYTEFTFLR